MNEGININDLPNEVLISIFEKIPSPYLIGRNSPRWVCHHWNDLFKDHSLRTKQNHKSFLDSCRDNPQAVIDLLTNERFASSLSLEMILRFASWHPDLASEIVAMHRDKMVNQKIFLLNDIQLAVLGQNILEVAEKIKELGNVGIVCPVDLFLMGQENLKIAEIALYSNEALAAVFEQPAKYLKLGIKKPAIAQIMLEDISSKYLYAPYIVKLGLMSQDATRIVLGKRELKAKLEGGDLVKLAERKPDVAEMILKDNTLRIKFSSANLFYLCMGSQNITCMVVADEELKAKLYDDSEEAIRSFNVEGILGSTKDVTILKKLRQIFLDQLGKTDFEIMKALLIDSDLKAFLREEFIFSTCLRHPTLFDIVIKDQDLKNKLSGKNLVRLLLCNPVVTQAILEDPTLISKLDFDFSPMSDQIDPKSVILILSNNSLKDKLNGNFLSALGSRALSLAQCILKNDKLRSKLLENATQTSPAPRLSNILIFCANHPVIAKTILNHPDFISVLDQSTVSELEKIISVSKLILSIVKRIGERSAMSIEREGNSTDMMVEEKDFSCGLKRKQLEIEESRKDVSEHSAEPESKKRKLEQNAINEEEELEEFEELEEEESETETETETEEEEEDEEEGLEEEEEKEAQKSFSP